MEQSKTVWNGDQQSKLKNLGGNFSCKSVADEENWQNVEEPLNKSYLCTHKNEISGGRSREAGAREHRGIGNKYKSDVQVKAYPHAYRD